MCLFCFIEQWPPFCNFLSFMIIVFLFVSKSPVAFIGGFHHTIHMDQCTLDTHISNRDCLCTGIMLALPLHCTWSLRFSRVNSCNKWKHHPVDRFGGKGEIWTYTMRDYHHTNRFSHSRLSHNTIFSLTTQFLLHDDELQWIYFSLLTFAGSFFFSDMETENQFADTSFRLWLWFNWLDFYAW